MRRAPALVTLAIVGPLSVAARAGEPERDAHQLLQRGVQLYREAAYASSVAALERARQAGGLDGAEQAECGFYLGADYVAMSSWDAARRELRALVEASPAYELPLYTSPKVAALFREAKQELQHMPRLLALPPRRLVSDGAARIELWFEAVRFGGTTFGAARWRWRGERGWHEAPLGHAVNGEQLVARLDADRGGTVEYFAEARGPAGVAQVGSPERPLELPVMAPQAPLVTAPPSPSTVSLVGARAPRRTPVARAWWLWTTVSVLAATGAGVGLYFALRPPGGTADAVLDFQVR